MLWRNVMAAKPKFGKSPPAAGPVAAGLAIANPSAGKLADSEVASLSSAILVVGDPKGRTASILATLRSIVAAHPEFVNKCVPDAEVARITAITGAAYRAIPGRYTEGTINNYASRDHGLVASMGFIDSAIARIPVLGGNIEALWRFTGTMKKTNFDFEKSIAVVAHSLEPKPLSEVASNAAKRLLSLTDDKGEPFFNAEGAAQFVAFCDYYGAGRISLGTIGDKFRNPGLC
jgi:hypothetical protein